MNWIERTLRAAHDQRFFVDLYTGNKRLVGGFVEEIDDETVVIKQTSVALKQGNSIVLIGSITSLIPYPGDVEEKA